MDPRRGSRSRPVVTPIVGVVLMIAMTVVLAGVVGSFMVAFNDDAQMSPTTTAFSVESIGCDGSGLIRVTYVEDRSVPADELYLRSPYLDLTGSWMDPSGYTVTGAGDGDISAGDAATICTRLESVTVSLVWDPANTGRSMVLGRKTVEQS